MRIALIVALVGLLIGPCQAQQTPQAQQTEQAEIDRIDVTESGLMTLFHDKAAGTNLWQWTSTTSVVPARAGTAFGFRYEVFGMPYGGHALLKCVVVFPPPGLDVPGKGLTSRETATDKVVINGDEHTCNYFAKDQWQVIAGPWRIEVWAGDRRLASRTFVMTDQQ